ncbi:ATP-dependent zinc metalloprotease FTSH 8, mitochondrial-like [Triticum dicoccoides]|uniref:ATP-dependent zinc metalloprotease FTSH 8, mitochondrial-like n=1 Tax=Triticum dicoccoides TaxID=85692 RepID=UPI00188F875B|nr:ATP-dependent zinc metalloprotease FTSH 8, mitochondrial-like [Triticum dicoccoides]
MACPPPSLLPVCEGARMCLVHCYLTSALWSQASFANGAGKVRDWRSLLANSQSRRLFSYQSKKNFLKEKKEVPKGDGSNKSESKDPLCGPHSVAGPALDVHGDADDDIGPVVEPQT